MTYHMDIIITDLGPRILVGLCEKVAGNFGSGGSFSLVTRVSYIPYNWLVAKLA